MIAVTEPNHIHSSQWNWLIGLHVVNANSYKENCHNDITKIPFYNWFYIIRCCFLIFDVPYFTVTAVSFCCLCHTEAIHRQWKDMSCMRLPFLEIVIVMSGMNSRCHHPTFNNRSPSTSTVCINKLSLPLFCCFGNNLGSEQPFICSIHWYLFSTHFEYFTAYIFWHKMWRDVSKR